MTELSSVSMSPDPQVVEELRSLFRKGATPSRLIRHIVNRHAGQPRMDVLVREYFREAFLVPMIRVDPEALERDSQEFSLASLNVNVVHRMLNTRREWDSFPAPESGTPAEWMETLAATDEAELIRRADPTGVPEIARSWDRMDREAQNYVRRLLGNAQALYERVLVLARLSEQLQQQVLDLEAEALPGR